MLTVLKTNDRALAERLRKMDDVVDDLYTAVKLYLTQISREALEEAEGRRWTDIVSFTINMEQVGDIVERIIIELEEKKIDKGRNFSEAGMAEICDLHARLIANLRLGLSVFLNGDLKSAQELLAQKVLFRDLERAYADSHLARLAENTQDSIETSSLHLDLISDMKRINSHISLDRLSDPRAGRRAREDAPQGARTRARCARVLPSNARTGRFAPHRSMPATELTLAVTLAVLGAGLLHAGWNALLKSAPGGDPLLDTATVVAGSGVWGFVVIPFVGFPDAAAWMFMLLSVAIHWAYYVTLAHAYRTGDLSFAYPLMRGTAPLIATLLSIVFLREWPTPQVALGIVLICAGIVGIAFVGPQSAPAGRRDVRARERRDHRRLHAGRRRRRAGGGQRRRATRCGSRFSRPFRSSAGSGGSAAATPSPTSRAAGAAA